MEEQNFLRNLKKLRVKMYITVFQKQKIVQKIILKTQRSEKECESNVNY